MNIAPHLFALMIACSAALAGNIAKQRARLAKYPELRNVKRFVSEWNMDLMMPKMKEEGYRD